jgi:hypothetical protein
MAVKKVKRLLLTGASSVQCGGPNTLGFMQNVKSIRIGFSILGYDVDWRPVMPGEDLSMYDIVICSLQSTGSMTAKYIYGLYWALTSHPKVILSCDDWMINQMTAHAKTCMNRPDIFWRTAGLLGSREPFKKDALKYEKQIHDYCAIVANGLDTRPLLLPNLGNGDLSKLKLPSKKVISYDPTPFIVRYPAYPFNRDRRWRVWVSANLSQNGILKKMGLTWPYREFGNLKTKQPRLPEHEIATLYGESWGVINIERDHAGSGWYRVRFIISADQGSILLCSSPLDAATLGEPYEFVTANYHKIEEYGNAKLEAIATAQRERLYSVLATPEDTLEKFKTALRKA